MERKSYQRGGIAAGVIRIIIALSALAIGVISLLVFLRVKEEHDALGIGLLAFIEAVILAVSLVSLISGIKVLVNGSKSLKVSRKGHEEWGRVLKLYVTEVFDRTGSSVSTYNLYTLRFEYKDDEGNLSTSEEHVSLKTYRSLEGREIIPIKVYGKRAILDSKRINDEGVGPISPH